MTRPYQEKLVEQSVTYTLFKDGEFIVIENVPARVNVETGEQLFAPETVERLQEIIKEKKEPVRIMTAPVFEFAAA